jgi:predicted O-methyltransferase YrrM
VGAHMTFRFEPRLQDVLDDLHGAARRDETRWKERTGSGNASANARGGGPLVRLGEFYLATSPEQGRLLYLLARMSRATTIVEFGASFGVSSLYLGAAARDNGGHLVTTEVHPKKCAALEQTFRKAGLDDNITLLEGDARETLRAVEAPVDMLFLDGWKSMYLPIYQSLRPKMRSGGVVVADNCSHEAARDYVAEVTEDSSRCITEIAGDFIITYLLA